MSRFTCQRAVQFHETDASGKVHYTQVLKCAEEGEGQWFESIGYPIFKAKLAWPRVHVECNYQHPIHYGDQLKIELGDFQIGNTSISYTFKVSNQLDELCAKGAFVIVCVCGEGNPLAMSKELKQAIAHFINS